MVTTGERSGRGINLEERPNKYKPLLTKHIIQKKKKAISTKGGIPNTLYQPTREKNLNMQSYIHMCNSKSFCILTTHTTLLQCHTK